MTIVFAMLILAPAVPSGEPVVTFSRWEMFDARFDTVEIWAISESKDGRQLPPTAAMRRTITYRPELKLKGQTTYVAESSECGSIVPALERLSNLQMPEIALEGLPSGDRAIAVRSDGASYRLSTDAYFPLEFGKVELTFGAKTPVAEWIDQSLRDFASCWKKPTTSR